MIKIGKNEVLCNFSQIMIPTGEVAQIQLNVYGWKITVFVEFKGSGTDQTVDVKGSGNELRLTFNNWSNGLGTSLVEPARLASLNIGGTLEMMAANYRIGSTNVFSIQFLHNKEGK